MNAVFLQVVGGDIIIGKTTPIEENRARSRIKKKDSSTPLRHSESGTVDQVLVTTNDQVP